MQSLIASLAGLLDGDSVSVPTPAQLHDSTEVRGIEARADAWVTPRSTDEVARVLAWCNDHDVAVTPRGGATGFAGGAVPLHGGVVLSLERMNHVRALEPLRWRMCVEAGLTTAHVRRLARENGLLFPPDPGAGEQSQIGGNIATNAGGPHAFKYGVTGDWVSGLEAVLAGGEVITLGGAITKDVAGYDLLGLLIGSEGTLAIITAAWLRLIPAPEAALPVVALYGDSGAGIGAIERVIGSGLAVAALEYLDAQTVAIAARGFPGPLPEGGGFMVIAEADGSAPEAARLAAEVAAAMGEDARVVLEPRGRADIDSLWRWRDGVSLAVTARLGGKVSEDIVVPFERLGEAVEATLAIGARHGLEACSWGHAGDGNLHATFLLQPGDAEALARAEAAAEELFALAIALGGSVSGEHGLGWVKRGQLARQWEPAALDLHDGVKALFDPRGILNPGKKLSRV
ncbi:MAG: FAD-linked oxidase C-terminal domain-containing protein [Solirubrobacteraceae bacterium]|jgi:glycolate oxidase subunit GlcD